MRSNHWLAVSVNDWIDLTSFHSKMNLHLLTSKVDNLPCLMLNSLILLVKELENHLLVFIFIPGGGACARSGAVAIEDIPKHDTWTADEEFGLKNEQRRTHARMPSFFCPPTPSLIKATKKRRWVLKYLMVGSSMRMCKVFMLQVSTLTVLYWIYLLLLLLMKLIIFSLYTL